MGGEAGSLLASRAFATSAVVSIGVDGAAALASAPAKVGGNSGAAARDKELSRLTTLDLGMGFH